MMNERDMSPRFLRVLFVNAMAFVVSGCSMAQPEHFTFQAEIPENFTISPGLPLQLGQIVFLSCRAPNKKSVYITVNVNEGEKYNVGEVKLSGDLKVPEDQIKSLLLVRPGPVVQVFRLLRH